MKKLIFILIAIPFILGAQLQTSTLLNIYPLGTIPTNYAAQPGPANNNTVEATYNDSLTAVIYLTWGTNSLTAANNFAVKIENTYGACSFPFTQTGLYVNYTALTPITSGTGYGYFKLNFRLKSFSPCTNSTGYTAYNLTIGGTASSSYTAKIPFKVYPLSTGLESLKKSDAKPVKVERYNILGQEDPKGLIAITYYEDGTLTKSKILTDEL